MTTALLLRELLRRLVLPPGGPMLLMLAGFLIVRRRRRVGGGLLAIGFLSLWLLATPWVAERLLLALQTEPVLDLTQPSGAQAVVILGGGVRLLAAEYGGDAPSDDSLRRIAFGAYVAKRTGTPILVSGGAVTGGLPTASRLLGCSS